MSGLETTDKDDFADAATKNLKDAQELLKARRWDCAGYHAGYAVECSIKGLLLVDVLAGCAGGLRSVAVRARALMLGDPVVHRSLQALRKSPYGHKLDNLRMTAIGMPFPGAGTIAMPRFVTKYIPRSLRTARVSTLFSGWSETLRYRGPGAIQPAQARRWCDTASRVVQGSIHKMILDGVIPR